MVYTHHVIFFIEYGYPPVFDIDHIDRNKLNNKIENLRDVRTAINCKNSTMKKNNTSGITGVVWDKSFGKWKAQAVVNGKCKYLGRYLHIDDAELAVKNFRANNGFTDSHGQRES